jgi:hypothetical protein
MTSADRLTLTAWATVTAAGLALAGWAVWRVLAEWVGRGVRVGVIAP